MNDILFVYSKLSFFFKVIPTQYVPVINLDIDPPLHKYVCSQNGSVMRLSLNKKMGETGKPKKKQSPVHSWLSNFAGKRIQLAKKKIGFGAKSRKQLFTFGL